MAIAFRAAGTAKKVASGNLASVAVPTGTTTNDIMVCVASAADNVVCTFPSGWTKKFEQNNGTSQRLTVAWKRAGASESAFTITHASGNSVVAQVFGYSGCSVSGDPFEVTGTGTTSSGSGNGTITAGGITPTHTNSAVLMIASETDGSTDGVGSNMYSGWSGTDPTLTEVGDAASESGTKEASLGAAWGLTTDGAATGSRTVSLSNPSTGTWAGLAVLMALTDASPTGGGGGSTTDDSRLTVLSVT